MNNRARRNRIYERLVREGAEADRPNCIEYSGMQDRALEIGKAVRVSDIVQPPIDTTPDFGPELQW